MPKTNKPPSYRFHKARNCAVVTIHGKNHYLGSYGSTESHETYGRLIAEWQKTGHGLIETPAGSENGSAAVSSFTVSELILHFLKFAQVYYRKHGQVTGEFDNIRCALRPLKGLYGSTEAGHFGPKELARIFHGCPFEVHEWSAMHSE